MIEVRSFPLGLSRRAFLKAGGAAVVGAGMPGMSGAWQGDPAPRCQRRSVADPTATGAIDS
jgi:hypothetical protein